MLLLPDPKARPTRAVTLGHLGTPEPSLGSGIGRGRRGAAVSPGKGKPARAAPLPDEGKQLLLKGGWSDKEQDLNSYNVAVYNMNTLDICLESSVLNEWEPSQDGAYKALSGTRVLQIVKICLNQLSLVSLSQ